MSRPPIPSLPRFPQRSRRKQHRKWIASGPQLQTRTTIWELSSPLNAVSLVKTGDYTEGVRRLQLLDKANPNSADIHMLLGEAFADQQEYATALDEYRKSLAIDPGQPQTHFLTGLALLRKGGPVEAV